MRAVFPRATALRLLLSFRIRYVSSKFFSSLPLKASVKTSTKRDTSKMMRHRPTAIGGVVGAVGVAGSTLLLLIGIVAPSVVVRDVAEIANGPVCDEEKTAWVLVGCDDEEEPLLAADEGTVDALPCTEESVLNSDFLLLSAEVATAGSEVNVDGFADEVAEELEELLIPD